MRRIYLDHNATSPLREECREAWLEAAETTWGNASSLHASGRRARARVDEARERVAAALRVREEEIVFTSGGTASNNLALRGALEARPPGEGMATSAVEHSSVLEVAQALEQAGRPVVRLDVDAEGLPDTDELSAVVRRGRIALVSVQAANNEIGTLPDLGAVRAAAEQAVFHTDAVQALGRVRLDLHEVGADLATFSAHKLGGPPGVGILWCRRGVPAAPFLHGGGQERGLWPGTENVAGIVSAALAIELAVDEQADLNTRLGALTASLWGELRSHLPTTKLLGPPIGSPQRLPNTLAVLLPGVDSKVFATRLDLEGLEVGAGSACASGSLEPSHVLAAMGFDDDDARAGLRLSLGRTTSAEDCAQAAAILKKAFVLTRAS